MAPRTCAIVSYYNQAHSAGLVLAALGAGPVLPDRVIVADDGSDPKASESLAELAGAAPMPVDFVWHPDDGFRKSQILNEAALQTDAELLVFLDGDCVPFRNLIEVYVRAYRPGELLTGAVGYLNESLSRRITLEDVVAGAHEAGLERRERNHFWRRHLTNLYQRGRKQTRPRIRGGNFAVCADLFRKVDGFDEVYGGYGREDSDLRNRMRNAGAKGVSLWHKAIAMHLQREIAPSGPREICPEPLYAEGRTLVRARKGLSTHESAK